MLKKFLTLLTVLFVFVTLWAQNPTKKFPYYYYETSGGPYNCYDEYRSYKNTAQVLENSEDWTVTLYRSNITHYLVHQYASGKAASRSELKRVLVENKSVYKELDKKIDEKKERNFHVCLVFLDEYGRLISSAFYSEDY